ncbi:hypothetical protein N790_12955 [Arenimonas malthae CC-JY-1]|uniref:Uncharacterized protein n=1 Tax=Arenimonas malthae CC-JY-1 TaxID=1384054 RepID=A0A091BMM7_9GAMM|nr:hypothetical protein [Arenimonas malthae]KFN52069.1 hypothetical protein N790_12955 [Arenimonas malthae CC-JY-1]
MTKPSVLFIALSAALAVSAAHAATTPQDELAAKQRAMAEAAAKPVARAGIRTKDIEIATGDTTGAPVWNRPLSDFSGLSGTGTAVPYVVHPFIVSANDTCSVALDPLAGHDTFLFIYENAFDPLDPLTNGVDGDDDGGGFPNSLIDPVALNAGTTYYAISTGYSNGSFGPYDLTIDCPVANVTYAGGVMLTNPASNNPIRVAEELVIPPARTITNAGNLDITTEVDYSFSPGEVRYARLHCPGVTFAPGTTVTYSGDPSNLIGAVNTSADGSIYFSITAGATPVVENDLLIVDGDRTLNAKAPVDCTYGLYDFPSQAQAGGATGRVATTSGAYIRFAPSYALAVDNQGNPVANVESADPAYSEFVGGAPTFDILLGQVGGFSYGTAGQVLGGGQPITLDGNAIELVDLMDADTALVFSGDFEAASDVFFSPNADCSVNIQSADSFDDTEAVFTIGSNAAMDHFLCYAAGGDPIRASEFTVALAPVSADATTYAVSGRGPLDLGVITRNGTELQAPLAQVPANYLSRMVLTNTGTQDRPYEIAVLGETGNVISTANLTGMVPAGGTTVVDLTSVLTGFTAAPRATLNVTISGPNSQIQGLYQIVNPDSGTISNHVMVRPGSN